MHPIKNGGITAISMAEKLQLFNYAEINPTLTHFITSFEGGWVYQIEDLEAISTKAKNRCSEIDCNLWSVEQMIYLFDEQLKLLGAVADTLKILKTGRLYKIENGEIELSDGLDDGVSSKKQAGGITAKTVNIGNAGNIGSTNVETPGHAGSLMKIAAVATILATIFAVFRFFST